MSWSGGTMRKSKIAGVRRRVMPPAVTLFTVLAVALFLGVVALTFVEQCDAVEIVSSSPESPLKSGEGDSTLQEDAEEVKAVENVKEEAEEEEEFEEFDEEGVEFDDDDEDDDFDDDEEDDEDDEDVDEDESDFEGEDFEDEFQGEEGSEPEEPEEKLFDETDVVVLGGANFSEFVNSNHYVLVEFYAPWCGHCQQLAPEYAEAATLLKGSAALAKVDATAHDDLAREYSVDSYPTLFFFIDGVHKKYPGHNKGNEIVDWVTKKTSLTVARLLTKDDAELIFDSQKFTMTIALLSSLEGEEVEEFTSAARQEDDVLFYLTNSAEVAEVFNIPSDIKRPALVFLKQEPEKVSWFDGPFKRDAISAFVSTHKLPLIVTFNKETSSLIFQSSIKKQVILFAGRDDLEKLKIGFMEASKALLGKLVFVHVDLDDSEQAPGIIEFFGLKGDKPAVMGYETQENGRKFLLERDITAENVKAFGEAFLSNSLKAHLKSEPIPETNDEDVKIVVGLNLDDIVLDESKDAFLEQTHDLMPSADIKVHWLFAITELSKPVFLRENDRAREIFATAGIYMPSCGHCHALEPIWKKLAKRLKTVESIVIAKMDGTANEHDRAKPDGYPTLLFFPAGKKSFDPITFDGDRTVKEFVKFLKKEAAIPFTVPKKPESQENSTAAESTIEPSSTTTSGEPISTPDSTPLDSSLESVIQDSFDSRKDEL